MLVFLRKESGNPRSDKKTMRIILLSFIVTLLASSSLYVLTGQYPNVGSYDNRGLSSAWFAMSLVMAYLASRYVKSAAFYLIPIVILLCLSSFLVSRDNYIKSYQTQLAIASDIRDKIKSSEEVKTVLPINIVANVPHYTFPNYNNAEVFSNPWDIGLMLVLKTHGAVKNANTLTKDRIASQQVTISDKSITIAGWEEKIDDLWYYEYNQQDEMSSLVKVRDKKHLEEIRDSILRKDYHTAPPNHFRETEKNIFLKLSGAHD